MLVGISLRSLPHHLNEENVEGEAEGAAMRTRSGISPVPSSLSFLFSGVAGGSPGRLANQLSSILMVREPRSKGIATLIRKEEMRLSPRLLDGGEGRGKGRMGRRRRRKPERSEELREKWYRKQPQAREAPRGGPREGIKGCEDVRKAPRRKENAITSSCLLLILDAQVLTIENQSFVYLSDSSFSGRIEQKRLTRHSWYVRHDTLTRSQPDVSCQREPVETQTLHWCGGIYLILTTAGSSRHRTNDGDQTHIMPTFLTRPGTTPCSDNLALSWQG